jgi:serine/threonine-protein kinase
MNGRGNEYVIDEQPLGEGRYGEVFRGRDAAGGPCAVRILHPRFHADPAVVHRFLQDRALLLGLTDPRLVRVRDLVVDEGQAFGVVTDLVEGPDLRDRLAHAGTFSPGDAARLGAEVARGLAAVHAAGFAHGDVKPANVLLDTSTTPNAARLADFAMARLFGDSEFARAAAPTRTAYLAPELSVGAPSTAAGDLYALGVMLYELVAGTTPFTGNAVVVMRGHAGLEPPRPGGVPDLMWDLISWLLAKDPSDRPRTALDVAGILDICAEAGETAASAEPVPVAVPLDVPVPVPMPPVESVPPDESRPPVESGPPVELIAAGAAEEEPDPSLVSRSAPRIAAPRAGGRSPAPGVLGGALAGAL